LGHRPELKAAAQCGAVSSARDELKTTGPEMTRDQIVAGLKDLLRQQKQVKIDLESISPDSPLDRIGFDSLSIMDFMYDVEDRFKVRIEITDLARMRFVKDLTDYLEGKLAG